jgi:sec-independent protein translocase protein TatC
MMEYDEEGMPRMSFLEHLEELRARIIKALYGFGAIFALCIVFSNPLFRIIERPGLIALKQTGNPNAHFVAIDVMEQFSIVYVWTPIVAALFLGSPWILWQVWAFISPGLYERERKCAVPFLLSTAGLFIGGGLFGYFVAWPDTLTFLLGAGGNLDVTPALSIDSYFDKFVDVMLGIGVAFELPVLIFMLSLLRVASPLFSAESLEIRDSFNRNPRGSCHSQSGCIHDDDLRGADVPAVFPRHLRELSAGAAARAPAVPVEAVPDLAGDHGCRRGVVRSGSRG